VGSSAPKGHADCAKCHEKHTFKAPEVTKCATCHSDRIGVHSKNVKGSCLTCHRPHGPLGVASPPACLSCHDRGKLPSLHQKSGHAKCTACHSSHKGPNGDRKTCTACHKDRANHEPDSPTCLGCHVFKVNK
jgi:hypothetical protein